MPTIRGTSPLIPIVSARSVEAAKKPEQVTPQAPPAGTLFLPNITDSLGTLTPGPNAGPVLDMGGDLLIQKINELLASTPGLSIRKAMYMAFATLAGLDLTQVQNYSHEKWDSDSAWFNGDQALSALGIKGAEHLVVWSDGKHGEIPGLTRLLSDSALTRDQANALLDRVAATCDPMLVASATEALLNNESLPLSDRVALLTRRLTENLSEAPYLPSGALQIPRFVASSSQVLKQLLTRLCDSPKIDHRLAAAQLLPLLKLPLADARPSLRPNASARSQKHRMLQITPSRTSTE